MAHPSPLVLIDDVEVITVGIVHENMLVRVGIRRVVERDPAFEVLADDARGAVDMVLRHRPRVLVLDLHQPGIEHTTEAVRQCSGDTRVLLLAESVHGDAMLRGLMAGALGVLKRPNDPHALLSAMRVIANGEFVVSPTGACPALLRATDRLSRDRLTGLTARERDVLTLLADGLGNAAIGRALFVSESAVKTHVSNILAKLDCENRVQAALIAYRAGLTG